MRYNNLLFVTLDSKCPSFATGGFHYGHLSTFRSPTDLKTPTHQECPESKSSLVATRQTIHNPLPRIDDGDNVYSDPSGRLSDIPKAIWQS